MFAQYKRLFSACEEQEFECTDGRCIPSQLVCNGNIDCLRGEDELCSGKSSWS